MADESNKPCDRRHMLTMLLGCLAPVVLIAILWFAGVSQSILTFGIILLCPVMHFLMMKNMKHENVKNGTHNIESKTDNENKREELT